MPNTTMKLTIDHETKEWLRHFAFGNDVSMSEYVRQVLKNATENPVKYYCVLRIAPLDWGWENLQSVDAFLEKSPKTVEAFLPKNINEHAQVNALRNFVGMLQRESGEPLRLEEMGNWCRLLWLPIAIEGGGQFVPCVTWKIDNHGATFIAAHHQWGRAIQNMFSPDVVHDYSVFCTERTITLTKMDL